MRAIGGGRPIPRTLLYRAALQASRCDATFRAFRARLEMSGRSVKQAILATARKLLTVLNAMLIPETEFVPPTA